MTQPTRSQSAVTTSDDYRARVMACWLGKAVGGTLGMPFEGQEGPFDLSFYTPVPTKMLPNDDLDLQVVWACVMDRLECVRVDRHDFAQAWLDHVEFPWCEYGVAIRNLRNGIRAPLCGSYDNWYTDSMGAPIRSEIWACLAPGNPKLAAAYAYEDACVDHGGEGVWSEVFLAALESEAFVESDRNVLLEHALGFLPESSRTRRAVSDTIQWWNQSGDWLRVRNQVLERYDSEDFTDAPMNIAFTVLGWLAGEGDFGRTICIAVNCGKDTDCTGATVGSLLGIMDPDCIPARWLEPIGRSLVLSPGIVGLHAPNTLDGFTDLVLDLRKRLDGRAPNPKVFEQSLDPFKIEVQIKYVDEMPEGYVAPDLSGARSLTLPGTVATMPAAEFEKEILLVRYLFHLDAQTPVRVMFDTREESRVWLDGKNAFSRAGGKIMPSFHMLGQDRRFDTFLAPGEHELIGAIRRPTTRQDAEWIVGIGHRETLQWIPDALYTSKI